MKFGVITFPGSNCDQDLIYALRELLGQQVVHLWHKDTDLQGADFVFLPGGFSYGDYLRSGAIACFSPIMAAVQQHAQQGGYVMGICNGFQILCEAGMLPGALLHNTSRQFICDYVYLTPGGATREYDFGKKALKVPIAHGEGNFYCDDKTLKQLEDNDQILFYYSDPTGNITQEWNPNGSLKNIAGIRNAAGNVLGMMPHPERAADPLLGNTDGRNILSYIVQLKPVLSILA